MKVKCVQLLDETSGAVKDSDAWLTVGKTYHVLSVYFSPSVGLRFQLIGDDGATPAYYQSDQFEVVSDYVPSCWKITNVVGSYFELAPRLWAEDGFLEAYFDGDSETVALFEAERKRMVDEEEGTEPSVH